MYKLILNDKVIGKYRTKLEADFYKKQYPKSKVVTDYVIFDVEKDIFTDDVVITAESPLKALQQYIKQNNLDIHVKCDPASKGRFVVRSKHTSRVYKVVE